MVFERSKLSTLEKKENLFPSLPGNIRRRLEHDADSQHVVCTKATRWCIGELDAGDAVRTRAAALLQHRLREGQIARHIPGR